MRLCHCRWMCPMQSLIYANGEENACCLTVVDRLENTLLSRTCRLYCALCVTRAFTTTNFAWVVSYDRSYALYGMSIKMNRIQTLTLISIQNFISLSNNRISNRMSLDCRKCTYSARITICAVSGTRVIIGIIKWSEWWFIPPSAAMDHNRSPSFYNRSSMFSILPENITEKCLCQHWCACSVSIDVCTHFKYNI